MSHVNLYAVLRVAMLNVIKLSVVMLNVIKLSVVMLNVIKLSVVMLDVVALSFRSKTFRWNNSLFICVREWNMERARERERDKESVVVWQM